ncbi:SAP98 [Candida theae]|uniref:SAP98 n=1 Tax=Candida theae TaxID=1198502 RepID=A0AAD5BB77_9ASCO|nr:SAP98 [Candida theae]KAI5949455.1 SAP98 [Candida theae]
MVLIKALIVVAIFAAITTTTPIEKRHDKYIAYPVEQVEDSSILGKRYEHNDMYGFGGLGSRYLTKLKVGSSKQEVQVIVDTGSWALNFPHVGGKCLGKTCSPEDSFDPSKSNSYKNLTKYSSSGYGGGGAKANGYKSTDDLYFDDGKKIPNFEFTLLDSVAFPRGIFGISPYNNPNVSYALAAKKAGLINQAGFSLYAGPDDKGALLLGGVDKAKYEGELALYKSTLSVPAKSITLANGTVINFASVLALDTGDAGLGLDPEITEKLFKEVSDESGKLSCDIALSGNKTLTFDLGKNVSIDVPYSDVFYWNADKTKCTSRIVSSGKHGATQNVGVPLIKHIYLTHNLDTGILGVAPVKHTDESDIVDFWF